MGKVWVVGKGTRPFVGEYVYDNEDVALGICQVLNMANGGGYRIECMRRIVGENVSPAAYWLDSAE